MSLGFDLSVDNYSTEDILSLLGLESNPSITEINNKIIIFTNMFREVNHKQKYEQVDADEEEGEEGEHAEPDNNVEKIINFFGELESRLYTDLFENIEIKPDNYLDYARPHIINNGLDVTRPFPNMSNLYDNIDPQELVLCQDANIIEQVNNNETEEEEEEIITINDIKFNEVHLNFEFSINDQLFATDNCKTEDRTIFKYRFNQQLNNVSELFLSQITVPIPYTISQFKKNNTFIIHDVNNDESHTIIIEDAYLIYYTDIESLVNYLNDEYFENEDNSSNILGHITLTQRPKPSSRYCLRFDLSNNPSFTTFTLNFNVDQEPIHPEYALNKILGFNGPLFENETILKGNVIDLIQPRLCFILDDGQVNYEQSLQINGDSILANDILGLLYLNAADLAVNDHILYGVFNITDRTQNGRKYNGFVNLTTITVKFIDNITGIIQQIPLQGYNRNTFSFILNITQNIPDINQTDIIEESNIL